MDFLEMLLLDLLRSAYDHELGRPKTAFPTRYHYIEVLRNELEDCGIAISRLGQHCLLLRDESRGRELVVVVRYITDRDLKLIAGRKNVKSCRIAYLIDDDYWAMLEDGALQPDYKARLEHFLTRYFTRLYPLLDAVIAPSRQILDRLPDLTGVHMQPAHLMPTDDLSHFDNPERIKMVFLGTSTHGNDFRTVAPGILAALKANPRLHLTTLLGKSGEELIPSGPHVTHMGDMFFPRFQRWLTAQRFHIGLAPYKPNPVNDGRSNLKVHQHALVGAVGIYSKTKPFLECVEDGRVGLLLENGPEAWRTAVLEHAAGIGRARQMAREGIADSKHLGNHKALAVQWTTLVPQA